MESIFTCISESFGELALVFTAVFLVTYLLYQRRVTDSGHELPPALPSLPIVGSLPFLSNKGGFPVFCLRQTTKLGKVFSFRAGSK